MKLQRATFLALAVTSVGIIAALAYSQNYYLPINKWGSAQVYGEQIGKDGYSCKRYELSYEQAQVAIQKLNLKSINETAAKEIHTVANCSVNWWAVIFPLEAQYYSSEYEGQVIKLASWKNGSFYLTEEER